MTPTALKLLKTMRAGACENAHTLSRKLPDMDGNAISDALRWLSDAGLIMPLRSDTGAVACHVRDQFYEIATRGEVELCDFMIAAGA